MLKEIICYTVVCDTCGSDSNSGSEISCWDNKDYAIESAENDGFVTIDEKHYCPDCAEKMKY